jgi:hypothetical protein
MRALVRLWDLVGGCESRMLTEIYSCEDSNAAQSSVTRCEEAALAAVWEGLVCWLYDANNRELIKSWD